MSMHWRNRSGESCAYHPELCVQTVQTHIESTARLLAAQVRALMLERNITCIYISLPFFAKAMIKILKESNVTNVVTRQDILSKSFPIKIPRMIKEDNYHTALLEQEICIRSKLFLWHHSTFSRMIQYARNVHGSETIMLQQFIKVRYPDVALK
ncbi:uncharacterized protein LOC144360712 [Saccoglossus kowalevskii]